MKYIDNYVDSSQDFWEIFPQFRSVQPFKGLYSGDRSDSKNKSSKAMWYLALTTDVDSEFYGMPKGDQIQMMMEVLGTDIPTYLETKGGMDKFEEHFLNFIATPLYRDVLDLEAKLLERKKFIVETEYTLDGHVFDETTQKYKPVKGNAAVLDKMLTDTKKIHGEIRDARAALKAEADATGKGGSTESFMET